MGGMTTRWWFQIYFFDFHPYLGKMSKLTHIFPMGWFNHQSDKFSHLKVGKIGCQCLGHAGHDASLLHGSLGLGQILVDFE